MPTLHPSMPPKLERRVQAVLALFRGVPAARVSVQFGICPSDLYKFRRRALAAMRDMHWRINGAGRSGRATGSAVSGSSRLLRCANGIRCAVPINCERSWGQALPVHGRFNASVHATALRVCPSGLRPQPRHDGCRGRS